jgi:hypothetical protein
MLKHTSEQRLSMRLCRMLLGMIVTMTAVLSILQLFSALLVVLVVSPRPQQLASPLWNIVGLLLVLLDAACLYWCFQVVGRIDRVLYKWGYWLVSLAALFVPLAIQNPILNYWLYLTD